MSKFRPLILLAVATLSAVIAYGLWSRPSVEKADSDNFSAERVVRDIEVISKKHHSVAHPAERAEVRDYLVSRLENLGADTVELFEYKNLWNIYPTLSFLELLRIRLSNNYNSNQYCEHYRNNLQNLFHTLNLYFVSKVTKYFLNLHSTT